MAAVKEMTIKELVSEAVRLDRVLKTSKKTLDDVNRQEGLRT